MKNFCILILFFLLLAVLKPVSSQPLALVNSFSARYYALGQADAVMQGDVDAILINPSGLADVQALSLGLFYTHWMEDMQFYSFRGAYPLKIKKKYYGTVALDCSAFSITPIAFYDEQGRRQPDLKAGDLCGSLGYGYKLWQRYNVGLTLKTFHTVLGEKTYNYNVFDAGVSADFSVKSLSRQNPGQRNLKVGVAAQNIDLLFSNFYNDSAENVLLPVKVKAGADYIFYSEKQFASMFLCSVNRMENYGMQYNLGMELTVWKILRLQGGYIINPYLNYHLTFGTGLYYNNKATALIFNYAVLPLDNFSTQHAFSFEIQFK